MKDNERDERITNSAEDIWRTGSDVEREELVRATAQLLAEAAPLLDQLATVCGVLSTVLRISGLRDSIARNAVLEQEVETITPDDTPNGILPIGTAVMHTNGMNQQLYDDQGTIVSYNGESHLYAVRFKSYGDTVHHVGAWEIRPLTQQELDDER